MKEVILDLNDMSDSAEVYNSRPNPVLKIFIYFVLAILVAAFIWGYFFEIEETTKCMGKVSKNESTVRVVNLYEGKISKVNIKDGKSVKKGDVLYTLENSDILKNKEIVETQKKEIKDRNEIIEEYIKALGGQVQNLDAKKDNPYYDEYSNRLNLVNNNSDMANADKEKVDSQYNSSLETYNKSIDYNNETLAALESLQNSIVDKTNYCSEFGTYYSESANAFINTYNKTANDYDMQIEAARKSGATQSEINEYISKKQNALSTLESENIANVQKEIENIKNNNVALDNKLSEARTVLSGDNTDNKIKNAKMTEKNASYTELETNKGKLKEIESNIATLKKNLDNSIVKAEKDGIVNIKGELVKGSALQAGVNVLDIIPKNEKDFKVIAYIEDYNIAKIKNGMKVKCELSAYPRAEYGTFNGTINNISKDIKATEEKSGKSYYVGEVSLDNIVIENKKGEKGKLEAGMSVITRVVTRKKNVLTYIKEKIHLFD